MACAALILLAPPPPGRADDTALDRVRQAGVLRWGADAEGGGPYVYPHPDGSGRLVGFEVDLMARLCGALGPAPRMEQGRWDLLLSTLAAGHVDVVVNGYEQTPERRADYLPPAPITSTSSR